jgi:hypothetical protein
MPGPTLSISKLRIDTHNALRLWHKSNLNTSPLNYLHLFRQVQLKSANSARQATNQILLNALEALAVEHEQEASLLRKRFRDGLVVQAVANWLNTSVSSVYRKQREAIEQLTLILYNKEVQARDDYQVQLEKRLKLPPEVHLIGVREHLATLFNVLALAEPVWLVSIEGLGGIGKTALANAVLRQPELTSQFHDIAWVSAKQQDFLPHLELKQIPPPALNASTLIDTLLEQFGQTMTLSQSSQEKKMALTRLLKEEPYLIVIDNLETVVDYQALLPLLRELVNPSKFLLTSRHSLWAYPDVFCRSLADLGQANTVDFIRHEARMQGLPLLAKASKSELNKIYEVVGGNPLALKLVVGQLSILPLSQVLENLKQARDKNIESLYTYIYWQAWHTLHTASQQVLLVMPLVQDGTLDQLLVLSQLELNELSQALQQLASLSLVQVGGDLEERRYTIHRLTETFLLNEAIKWQSPS